MPTDDLDPNSFAGRDSATQKSSGDLQKMLQDIMAVSDRSGKQLQKEVTEVASSVGQLTKLEYAQYRMYELDKKQRREFISDWLHWQIDSVTGDSDWGPRTVNKAECTSVLNEAAIPTIPVTALVDPSQPAGGGAITSASELEELLASAELPLFAKPNQLLGSFGAFRIDSFSNGVATINGSDSMTSDELLSAMGGISYLLAPVMRNHPDIADFAEALATIRTVNFVKNGEVQLVASVFKIPVAGNIADNFWRDGNLLADIDPESGRIRRAITGVGPYQTEHQVHPETQAQLVGFQTPGWPEVLELNRRTAEVFGALRYQTLDIAVTPDGPIVVEVNSGGSFSLPQLASGQGFLTKQNRSFFEKCGVNFRSLENAMLKAG
jgi:hypothetical protein